MEYNKVCKRCNKPFVAHGNRAEYCPDCKVLHIREMQEQYRKEAAARKRMMAETKGPKVSVNEIATKARAVGMTYGQYVAKYGEVEE